MYSVVLLVAMTTTMETPDFCHRRGCGGCGCSVSYCHGCGWSGYCGGGYGYCGGGYGYCHGGCWGGYGCGHSYSYGCGHWHGHGHTYGCGASYGYSGCGHVYGGCGHVYNGGYGHSHASVSTGYSAPVYASSAPAAPVTAVANSSTLTPATLVVTLPQGATLTIDGNATTSTAAQRTFRTPPLEVGKAYQYTLRATVTTDGVDQTVTRDVPIRAGEQARVNLEFSPAGGTASR